MNQVAIILGVSLPSFRTREAVMQDQIKANEWEYNSPLPFPLPFPHHDSLSICEGNSSTKDDDTVTTQCSTDGETSVDTPRCVSFAENPVTEVNTRPYTTIHEKCKLFYSDWEYVEFRRDAYCYNRREKVVTFSDSVVSNVWIIPTAEDPSSMYYSETELQSFLDDFLSDLKKRDILLE